MNKYHIHSRLTDEYKGTFEGACVVEALESYAESEGFASYLDLTSVLGPHDGDIVDVGLEGYDAR